MPPADHNNHDPLLCNVHQRTCRPMPTTLDTSHFEMSPLKAFTHKPVTNKTKNEAKQLSK